MRKKIFLALLVIASSPLYAQDVTFGLRVGPSFSTLGGGGASFNSKYRVGFHAGGYASFTISESLSFEAGLQFADKGARVVGDGVSVLVPSAKRNSYVDLPLLLKIRSGKSFYLLAGAQPSILISSAEVYKDENYHSVFRGSDISGHWKGGDVAGVIGVGVEVGAGMHIQTTYEHGFANISEISESVYNRGFKLTVGKSF